MDEGTWTSLSSGLGQHVVPSYPMKSSLLLRNYIHELDAINEWREPTTSYGLTGLVGEITDSSSRLSGIKIDLLKRNLENTPQINKEN